jgi:hypothetical protein
MYFKIKVLKKQRRLSHRLKGYFVSNIRPLKMIHLTQNGNWNTYKIQTQNMFSTVKLGYNEQNLLTFLVPLGYFTTENFMFITMSRL